jgi:hypothetical protein
MATVSGPSRSRRCRVATPSSGMTHVLRKGHPGDPQGPLRLLRLRGRALCRGAVDRASGARALACLDAGAPSGLEASSWKDALPGAWALPGACEGSTRMATLANIRKRCMCAVCGACVVLELDGEPAPVDPRTKSLELSPGQQFVADRLCAAGWRLLSLEFALCPRHAELYQDAKEDELHFLRDKLWAHRTAFGFSLEFYIHNGRVVTETGARPATAQELQMWGILLRQAQGKRL